MKVVRRAIGQRIVLVLPGGERVVLELTASSRTRSSIGITAPQSVLILTADERPVIATKG